MTSPAPTDALQPGEVLLALDVGQARIGLARGEVGLGFAFGRGALRRTRHADDVRHIADVAREEGATRLVVGLPRRTDGRDSKQTQRVRAFADALRTAGLIVAFEDERFTTAIAERDLAHGALPMGKRRDKGRVDEASAILILESYLRRLREGAATTGSPQDEGTTR
ncbi:MAG: Holliday junction resolvase RuvX [Trueperaceae bacterium]